MKLAVTDSCLKNPCLNDGECINEDGKPACKCKGRYSGQFCESKLFCFAIYILLCCFVLRFIYVRLSNYYLEVTNKLNRVGIKVLYVAYVMIRHCCVNRTGNKHSRKA